MTTNMNTELYHYLNETSQKSHHKSLSLTHLVSYTLFRAYCIASFGDSFPIDIYSDFMAIENASYFLILSIPWPSLSTSRARSRATKALEAFMKPWIESEREGDVEGVSPYGNDIMRALAQSGFSTKDMAGTLLTYFFGIFANTNKSVTWLITHLLYDRAAHDELRTQLDHEVKSRFTDWASLIDTTPRELRAPHFKLLDSGLKEAMRLHASPMIARVVTADVTLPSSNGPLLALKGEMVLPNIPAVHMNADYYADPCSFRLDRFHDAATLTRHLYAFGRGTHTVSASFVLR